MSITAAKWIADPNHIIRILATITMKRPMDMGTSGDDWTADATQTACYYATWPPADHDPNMAVRPSAVYSWNGTTLTAYTAATSAANCNSTDGSWYYDRSTRKLYVNTTGAGTPSALPTRIWVYYPLRLATHDFPGKTGVAVAPTVAGVTEDVQFYGVINSKPSFTRSIGLFESVARIGGGTIGIADNLRQFDWHARFSREEIYDAPITIQMGGGIEDVGEMTFATYITVATGRILGVNGSPETGAFSLEYADASTPYSSEYASGADWSGRPDQIIASACAAASPAQTAPTNATDLTTDRNYHCVVSRQESARLIELIGKVCGGHLMMFYIKRDGTPMLDYWQIPDSGETLGGTFYQRECISLSRSIIQPYSTVNALANTGTKGSRPQRSQYDANSRFETKMYKFTGGSPAWTDHAVASNTAYQTWDKGGDIEKVLVNGVEFPRQDSLNGVDTDNVCWGYIHDDGLTSGNPNRIYVNPNSAPEAAYLDGVDVLVYYRVEKERTTQSITSGAGSKDTNVKTATSAELKAVRGRDRVFDVSTFITNATNLQSFADTALALVKYPLDVFKFSTPLTEALQTEINSTIKFIDADESTSYWRVLELSDNPESNRCEITCWKQSDSALL